MAEKAYTLKKKKQTNELHLFEGDFSIHPCNSESQSICKKMKKTDSIGNVFSCQKEQAAREKCAEEGRKVCGTCVSHLYSSY